jgi:hypothetical protein
MDPRIFRVARERIERLCENLEVLISKRAVSETEAGFSTAEALMRDLRKSAEGEIQKRSVGNLNLWLWSLSERIDEILSKREAGKTGEGNIAFKCTWNDRGYRAPCSNEAYRFNVREGRTICSLPSCGCREYGEEVDIRNNPCYESIALKEMYFGAGWDHTGEEEKPRHIHNVKEGKVAVLTTRPPGTEEADRLVIGCLLIDRVNDDPGEETKIFGDKERSIEVPFREVKVRFWDYYRNPGAEDVILWASGLFRYISDGTVLGVLGDISDQYRHTGRAVTKVIDLMKHCKVPLDC